MVKKVLKKKKKVAAPDDDMKVKVKTPPGILSYPYLAEADTGREMSDDKFKTDLLITKKTWKEEGEELKEAVLTVARKFFRKKNITLKDFANPFKDTDKLEKYSDSERTKGCVMIRAKSDFQPTVVDASKRELSAEEIAEIKGGDEGRLVVVAYPYTQDGGGVTLGLNLVQFKQAGEALGEGKAANLAMVDEMEIDMEDVDDDDDEEEETPRKKKKAGKKIVAPEEDDEEEEEESDDDEDSEEVESDEDDTEDESDSDDEEEEEEEDEPAPSKKAGRKSKNVKASKTAVSKKSKASKRSADEDDDDSDSEEEDFEFD